MAEARGPFRRRRPWRRRRGGTGPPDIHRRIEAGSGRIAALGFLHSNGITVTSVPPRRGSRSRWPPKLDLDPRAAVVTAEQPREDVGHVHLPAVLHAQGV